MQQIVLASNNNGKLEEFQQIFGQYNIEVIPQKALNVPEIDEPFITFVENSLHKARHCANYTKLPALADDSGICVKHLGGAPGVYSARYAGLEKSEEANNNKLLAELNSISERSAYFYCSLVMVRSGTDPQPIIAEGICEGEIAHAPKGYNGHGYDPVFYLPEYKANMGELSPEIRNKISHRGKAIQELLAKLVQAGLIKL